MAWDGRAEENTKATLCSGLRTECVSKQVCGRIVRVFFMQTIQKKQHPLLENLNI